MLNLGFTFGPVVFILLDINLGQFHVKLNHQDENAKNIYMICFGDATKKI